LFQRLGKLTHRATDETGSGGDSDKSGNGTGTETDNGPFTFKPEIHNHPGNGTGRARQVGVENGESGLHGCGKTRSTVETEPTDPKEDCTEDDLGDVGRFKDDSLGSISSSVADKIRVGETTGT